MISIDYAGDLVGVAVAGFLRAGRGLKNASEDDSVLRSPARSGAAVLAELQRQWGPIPLALAEESSPQMEDMRGLLRGQPAPQAPEISQRVCDALFLPGACIEISSLPGSGAYSVVLQLMRMALATSSSKWLGALEATNAEDWGQLHAPAVAASGIPLDRLLLVRSPRERLRKMAVRLSAQPFFVALLIDVTAVKNLGEMSVAIRRLSINARHSGCTIFLMTSLQSHRPRSLSVAVRAAIRPDKPPGTVKIEILRHREGRLTPLATNLPVFLSEDFMFSPTGKPLPNREAAKNMSKMSALQNE